MTFDPLNPRIEDAHEAELSYFKNNAEAMVIITKIENGYDEKAQKAFEAKVNEVMNEVFDSLTELLHDKADEGLDFLLYINLLTYVLGRSCIANMELMKFRYDMDAVDEE